MNYIEIDIVDDKKIISEYHQIIKEFEYSRIVPDIHVLEWILFKKGSLNQFKNYVYIDSLLSGIGYDKIDNVAIIKLKDNSEFSFNRERTYKKNYRVYEIPLIGGGDIDYCNDEKSIYSLEFNKLYLINAEKKLKILNHSDKDYINITITVKNDIQHLNLANSSVPPVIKKFYNHLHFNKQQYISQPDNDNYLFNYKKINETCVKKSENFISLCGPDAISLLYNLKSCNNTSDVYIWIYKGLDINIETFEDDFYDSSFNIYYNIAPLNSYKWGGLINIYLFKKYYNKVLLIKDKIKISGSSIDKILKIENPKQIVCGYGFNFINRHEFNNKTLVHNNLVDYASLDFACLPIELISDEFFEWVCCIENYVSRMEHIVNMYSVTEKNYELVSYELDIKYFPQVICSKENINYLNACHQYFIEKYNYPFKYINKTDLEDIDTINEIIVTVVLRNNVTIENLKECLNSIKYQRGINFKVCIINDRFWGDYDIVNALVEYIQLDNWYYIDNTFNLGTFMSVKTVMELFNLVDEDIIINVEPYLKLLNEDIIKKIVHSFNVNNIKILLGNISCGNLPIFNFQLINWSDTDKAFNVFLNRQYCDTIINPLINKSLIYTNPLKFMFSFSCKYFRYICAEDFNNDFVLEMLNKSEDYIEIFCKPISQSLVLDNKGFDVTNYKRGNINYSKFTLKTTLEQGKEISFRFHRRKYIYEYFSKESKELYIIFASKSKWASIKHLIPIFRHINCNVVLLKDKNEYFLKGIPNLSSNIDFTIEYIRKIIASTKSSVVKTYGIGDSAFAAIYYGIVCKVNSIIVKNPEIKINNKTDSWKSKIAHDNSVKVFFDLRKIRSYTPIKYITSKDIQIPNSLNIKIFKEPHIDLGYFVNEIFSPM